MTLRHSQFTLTLIGIIAVGAIVLVVGLVLWQQLQSRVNATYNAYAKKQAKLERMEKQVANLPLRLAESQRLDDELATLDRGRADYEYMPTYLEELQRVAAKTGNKLLSIRPNPMKDLDLSKSPFAKGAAPAAGNAAGAAPASQDMADLEQEFGITAPDAKAAKQPDRVQQISLEMSGTYISVLRFLDALRSFSKLVYVKTVDISPVKSEKDKVTGVSARFETYAIITPDQFEHSQATDNTAPAAGAKQ